ncbi:hypothetical protein UK15_37625 [Streptomyces variegatus]|uniref:XRE family transcriptional regulator n=1 Tax=Streptomyces variegatus TaxID=284040 RepID=A0A0M2GGS4_9ACTN|nr:hypothetical protein UK15_37625 [Streptomyces variegatus]
MEARRRAFQELLSRRERIYVMRTLTAAASHFGLWPTATSNLERGLRRDDALARAYKDCLNAA